MSARAARGKAEAAGRGRAARKRGDEVLDAAARVFARRGYADASVQDIADELGILKGSLYHYIKKKEDLLFWLLEAVHEDVDAILEEVAQVDDLAPLERIELYVKRQVLYNLDNLERISIYYHDVEALSEERLAVDPLPGHTHERFITGLIKEAQQQGAADPSTIRAWSRTVCLATIIWTYRWYKPNGRISRQSIAHECARFALQGVAGTPA